MISSTAFGSGTLVGSVGSRSFSAWFSASSAAVEAPLFYFHLRSVFLSQNLLPSSLRGACAEHAQRVSEHTAVRATRSGKHTSPRLCLLTRAGSVHARGYAHVRSHWMSPADGPASPRCTRAMP